jgi:hypothetical protein
MFDNSKHCFYCGFQYTHGSVRDHVVPRSAGGSDGNFNRRLACVSCDHIKANMSPEEFCAKHVPQSHRPRVAAEIIGIRHLHENHHLTEPKRKRWPREVYHPHHVINAALMGAN